MSIAQNPIAIAADVRTNCERDMRILRRQRSVSSFASRIIPICSGDGGGGAYSSFDAGRMSTGRSSGISGQECRPGPSIGDGPEGAHVHLDARAPQADLAAYGTVTARDEGRVTLKVERQIAPERAARLVNDLGDNLADISVEDPPIEEVIDRVFSGERVGAAT